MIHYLIVKIEGINLGEIVNLSMKEAIHLQRIKYTRQTELTCIIHPSDLDRLRKALGLRYQVTIIGEGGIVPRLKRIVANRAAVAGFVVFCLLILAQSFFIADIEIKGNVSVDSKELGAFLDSNGLKVGAFKYMDYKGLEKKIYAKYDKVVWVRIRYEGRYVLVDMSETDRNYGKELSEEVDDRKPCSIVAKKSGYIFRIRPLKGVAKVEPGQYVKKGKVLISGKVPMNSYAYGTDAEHMKEYYTHALGKVEAKIPYSLNYYTPRRTAEKTKTGKSHRAITIDLLDKTLDLSLTNSCFKRAIVKEVPLINISFPFPIKISWKTSKEVRVKWTEIPEKQLRKDALMAVKCWSEEKLGEKAKISKKSLNFTRKKNIIRVTIVIEAIEEIGKERILVLGTGKESKNNNR